MFHSLLEKTAQALDAAGIPYMVIGGQAVLLYGEPRLTKDVDITLGVGPERLPDVLDAVEGLGWRVLSESPQEFVEETLVLPCLEPEGDIPVDLIVAFSPYEQQAVARAKTVPIGQAQVRFASLEDLIIHKMIAGRPRDLADVRTLLLKNPQVEFDYIHEWLEQFQDALDEPFLSRFQEIRDSAH